MGKWLAIYLDLPKMNSNESNERNDLLNNFMKQYKDSLLEEEQEEKKRKDELLKGANVVTGKHQETTGTTGTAGTTGTSGTAGTNGTAGINNGIVDSDTQSQIQGTISDDEEV